MQKVYADVFEQIITEMEQGRTPWVRPWTGGGPYNAATGRRYSGGNVIALIFAGAQYSTQGWLTWNQAIEAGCVVRKGERSTTVFFMSNKYISWFPTSFYFSVYTNENCWISLFCCYAEI